MFALVVSVASVAFAGYYVVYLPDEGAGEIPLRPSSLARGSPAVGGKSLGLASLDGVGAGGSPRASTAGIQPALASSGGAAVGVEEEMKQQI